VAGIGILRAKPCRFNEEHKWLFKNPEETGIKR
jgi:hypothetical protein